MKLCLTYVVEATASLTNFHPLLISLALQLPLVKYTRISTSSWIDDHWACFIRSPAFHENGFASCVTNKRTSFRCARWAWTSAWETTTVIPGIPLYGVLCWQSSAGKDVVCFALLHFPVTVTSATLWCYVSWKKTLTNNSLTEGKLSRYTQDNMQLY